MYGSAFLLFVFLILLFALDSCLLSNNIGKETVTHWEDGNVTVTWA